ncbi:MAG TPA: HAD-IIA family hydrolase [Acidimicrobiia bacterium]
MTVLCDLDGVVYRGGMVLPGVKAALERLDAASVPVLFITNNSTRTPRATAEKIAGLTGVPVAAEQVLTSALAAMTLLDGSDGPVLIVGEEGVKSAVEQAGLTVTEDPLLARAVVVGLTRSLTYELVAAAMQAIRGGARFVATNNDTTFPTEEGLAPGCGAIVAAIAAASGVTPEVAGKPNKPMRDLIRSKVDGEAWIIGDRLDTDIALAAGESGWHSILVLTGVSGDEAITNSEADYVVADLPTAVDLVLGHLQQS